MNYLKTFFFSAFLILVGLSEMHLSAKQYDYPNFIENPLITNRMQKRLAPLLLPLDHPIKPIVDALFGGSRVTQNETTLIAAGFEILHRKTMDYIVVATHPAIPGYLFKIYLDTEKRQKQDKPAWHWLANRCEGAAKIKSIIKKNNISHFIVSKKWLYPLPYFSESDLHPVILIVKDMNLVKRDENLIAWKTLITKTHLKELNTILKHGSGSRYLSTHIPYSQQGKFVFVNTEYSKTKINYGKIRALLSEPLQIYWDKFIP